MCTLRACAMMSTAPVNSTIVLRALSLRGCSPMRCSTRVPLAARHPNRKSRSMSRCCSPMPREMGATEGDVHRHSAGQRFMTRWWRSLKGRLGTRRAKLGYEAVVGRKCIAMRVHAFQSSSSAAARNISRKPGWVVGVVRVGWWCVEGAGSSERGLRAAGQQLSSTTVPSTRSAVSAGFFASTRWTSKHTEALISFPVWRIGVCGGETGVRLVCLAETQAKRFHVFS